MNVIYISGGSGGGCKVDEEIDGTNLGFGLPSFFHLPHIYMSFPFLHLGWLQGTTAF